MASEKIPSIFDDRAAIGSSAELDKYGVWVKSGPEDFLGDGTGTIQEPGGEIPDFDAFSTGDGADSGILSDGFSDAVFAETGTEEPENTGIFDETFDTADLVEDFETPDFSDSPDFDMALDDARFETAETEADLSRDFSSPVDFDGAEELEVHTETEEAAGSAVFTENTGENGEEPSYGEFTAETESAAWEEAAAVREEPFPEAALPPDTGAEEPSVFSEQFSFDENISLDEFAAAPEEPSSGLDAGVPNTDGANRDAASSGDTFDDVVDGAGLNDAGVDISAAHTADTGETAFGDASLDDFFLDEDFALPDDDDESAAVENAAVPSGNTAAAGQTEISNQLLLKIANELSSIKGEITSLKEELSAVQVRAASVVQDADGNTEKHAEKPRGGFLNGAGEETIALTGDEMDNILRGADFTEEEGAIESLDSTPLYEEDLGDAGAEEEASPFPSAPETAPKEEVPQAEPAVEEAPEEIVLDFSLDDISTGPETAAGHFAGTAEALLEDPRAEEPPEAELPQAEPIVEEAPEEITLDFSLDDIAAGPETAADDFAGADALAADAPVEEPRVEEPPEEEVPQAEPGTEEPPEEIALDFPLDDDIVPAAPLPEKKPKEASVAPQSAPVLPDEDFSMSDVDFAEMASALEGASLDEAPGGGGQEAAGFEDTIPEAFTQDTDAALEDDASFFTDSFAGDENLAGGSAGFAGAENLALEIDADLELDTSLDEPVLEDFAETGAASTGEPGIIFEDLDLDLPDDDALSPPAPEEEAESLPDIVLDNSFAELTEEKTTVSGLEFDGEDVDPAPASGREEPEEPVESAARTAKPVLENSAETAEAGRTGKPEVGASAELAGVPERLKNELRTVLSYMDQLLESLPEEKIEEFARSEHFDTYKKLFEELGLV
jgi:hypothetical protein